jgi:hypothetical protein
MPDLDAFEAEVKVKINQLSSSKDAKLRLEAARWLGEAGEPSAITALSLVYRKDPDKRVREAAAYSLGMFKALAEAWNGDNRDEAVRLLEAIALDGKMGKRAALPVRRLVRIELALLISAALVAVLSFVLPQIVKQPGAPVADKERTALLTELRTAWQNLAGDANTLQQQFQAGTFKCDTPFQNVAPFRLSANNEQNMTDVAAIVKTFNEAQALFTPIKAKFDESCRANTPLTPEELSQQMAALGTMMQKLPDIGRALVTAESVPIPTPTIPAIDAPTAQPTTAGAPTVPPSPTTKVDIRQHVTDLQKIVDQMTDLRGLNTLLRQYWTEARNSGQTVGCQETLPAIPPNYALPAETAQASPDLKLAADLVNTGLTALRTGQQLFTQACGTGSPGLSADAGLRQVNIAQQAFTTATTQLTRLRGTGG